MSDRDIIGRAIHGQAFADGGYILVDSILEDLAEAGYVIVKLPEPNGFWGEGPEWAQDAAPGDSTGWVAWTAVGGLVMLQRVEPGELTPDQARELGAALLAAAAHAEQVSDD